MKFALQIGKLGGVKIFIVNAIAFINFQIYKTLMATQSSNLLKVLTASKTSIQNSNNCIYIIYNEF